MARTADAPLVGRDEELAAFQECFDRAARCQGALVVVEGEPGVGKSRLVAEAVAHAGARGWDVRTGIAREFDDRALAPLTEALAVDVGAFADSNDAEDSGRLQTRAIAACLRALEECVREAPTVVVVDDLQWADTVTLSVLRALAREVAFDRAVIVVTARFWPRSPELHRLVDDFATAGARRLALAPLSAEQAVVLAAASLGVDGVGPKLQDQLSATGGNPFFVTQLIAALDDEQAVAVDEQRAEVGEVSVPASVQDTVLRRLASLPDETIEVLQGAALLGASFEPSDLAAALGRSSTALVRPLADARQFGLLREDGDRLAFGHDLVRESIYADIPSGVRRGLHVDVGRALAAANVTPERVARHFVIGAEPGDTEALEWLERAGDSLSKVDASAAVEMFERALELTDPAAPSRASLLARLVPALVYAGRLADAQQRATEWLATDPEPESKARMSLCLGDALLVQGNAWDARVQFEEASKIEIVDAALHAELVTAVGTASAALVDLPRVRHSIAEGLELGRASGSSRAVIDALSAQTQLAINGSEYERALALAEEGIALNRASGEAPRIGIQLMHGLALMAVDRLADGEQAMRAAVRSYEDAGAIGMLPMCHSNLVHSGLLSGQWDDALAEVDAARSLRDETGARLIVAEAVAEEAMIHLHRGDLAAAAASFADVRAQLELQGLPFTFWSAWTEAHLAAADGDTPLAVRVLSEMMGLMWAIGIELHALRCGPDLVRLAIECGDDRQARATTEQVQDLADRADVPSARGARLLCTGLVERDADDLIDAIPHYQQSGRPFETLLACLGAGPMLADLGRRDEAVAVLQHGAKVAEGLGATYDERRISALLRDLGVSTGARTSRKRAATGWESLTPTEREVTALVADGLTNMEVAERLFISHRTVTTHLTRIFNKLGLRSRTELTAEVHRRAAG